MNELVRTKKRNAELMIDYLTLEIECKAALAALAVSSEVVDKLKIKIEQERSRLRALTDPLAKVEAELKLAKAERDELKSLST